MKTNSDAGEQAMIHLGRNVPNKAGQAKILTTTIAVGGKAVLRGAAGKVVRQGLESSIGSVGKGVLRGGGKLASRVAPVLAVVEFGIDQKSSYDAYHRGEITRNEYEVQTAGNVGNAAIGLAGAAAGAALGSALLPGVGTLIGGILGGIFGGGTGRKIGRGIAR